jgi:hypothetical protein
MEDSKEIIEIRHSLKELYESRNETNIEIVKLQENDKAYKKDVDSLANNQRKIDEKIDKEIMPVLRKNAFYLKIIWGLVGFIGIQTGIIIFRIITNMITKKIGG